MATEQPYRLVATDRQLTWRRVVSYEPYMGSGWRRYGRLVVNFHNHVVTSVYFNGEQVL